MAERPGAVPRPSGHAVTSEEGGDLRAAMRSLGLGECRVSVALVGGAAQMSDSDLECGVLDGGTDTGVFRLIGRERAAASFASRSWASSRPKAAWDA